ncbi:wall-associated receptor kinase-like 1 [Lactuca sativa]|nr:wall-associated receptor kinase-like 1 [Lactuca sativa]
MVMIVIPILIFFLASKPLIVILNRMQLLQVLHLLILISLTATVTKAERISKKGCNDRCGEISIPYPFGIGTNCSLNKWYNIDCNSSTPYLSALNNTEFLNVNSEDSYRSGAVTVKVSMTFDCMRSVQHSTPVVSNNSPFYISTSANKLFVEGCGINADVMVKKTIVASCSTICRNDTVSDRNNCFGIGCCQATIDMIHSTDMNYGGWYYSRHLNFKTFRLNVTGLEGPAGDETCRSAFLMDSSYFRAGFPIDMNSTYVPITLSWYSDTLDDNNTSPECKKCQLKGGYCQLNLDVDSATSCIIYKGRNLGVILGVSISMGLLFLMVMGYALYKIIKKTKAKRRKQRFFKRNGGLLLKQQQAIDVEETILFTSKELEKATDRFNENRILGRGGQGTVYKGMLADGRIVAIKKSMVVDESQLVEFINEVVILSQVNHRNVVKLLGCCLETEVPLLVSEFVSNGTLYDLIQNETDEFSFSLHMRLQIATEIAGALSYLHSATSIPIYHRDIKTTNILLDEKYRAKVSDFGTSRLVSIDQTHLTTLVKGTFGYLDPEYFQSSQFTEKSDVYSFGVVLLELLTREKPISLTRFGENRSLATHFMLAMEEGRAMSIFDAMIVKEGFRTELLSIANLAMRCLNFNGKNRPTMKEVSIELECIRLSHVSLIDKINVGLVKQCEVVSPIYGKSTSTSMTISDNRN